MRRGQFLVSLLLLLVLLSAEGLARQPAETQATHVLYVTGSTTYFIQCGATINYDLLLFVLPWEHWSELRLRVGAGPYYFSSFFLSPGGVGASGSIALHLLAGRGPHHLEISGGGSALVEQGHESMGFLPLTSVGYRFQDSGAPLVFRVGLGFPMETVYVSIGTIL